MKHLQFGVFKTFHARYRPPLSGFRNGTFGDLAANLGFGPRDAWNVGFTEEGMARLNGKNLAAERRQWPRLPLAIPVFVRSQSETEKEFLEFATALNVSAGGMLVAVRRSIPSSAQVLLEIPSAPLAAMAALPRVARNLRAKVLRMQHGEGYNLIALKFSRPLLNGRVKPLRRKLASSV
jgi:hypothetical protein